MKRLKTLLIASLSSACLCASTLSLAGAEDIYAVQFSEDGRFLVTGGSGGNSMTYDKNFSGGIKLWDVNSGKLIKAFGQQVHIQTIFGDQYGRIGKRRWGIHSFKDIVLNGSYPEGKILLLPSSLGRMDKAANVNLPDFFGGTLDFGGKHTRRIPLAVSDSRARHHCGTDAAYEFIGPVVASDNGRFAAVVVNTCKEKNDRKVPIAQYDSTLHVVDLTTLKVVHSRSKLDSGVYAAGISNDGNKIAYVGRDRFAVLDIEAGSQQVVESYPNAVFQIPRQFSALYFNRDASKLVSLNYIYDIACREETELSWSKDSAVRKGRTSSVKVAPDLSYFVLVKPKRSFIVFGEDGLPKSYGKADKVFVVDTRTGDERELTITDSRSEGKRCVTDVSPDSRRVAVACAGGLLKVFDAASGNLVWEQRNIGYKKLDLDEGLLQVRNTSLQPLQLALR
ncbi:hypothetical protein QVG61_05370 [Thiohalobacter sp. IOR34]|uniref:hypothetical protein n=1 Tax=Thiohalobacter sp. IOR34 TaxID=3057176 RepID=UPI0025B00B9F|nr:hypothetical protein [Thiohalobacter sp. IOR34]WJW76520.1 hypothetical protein QVG61_05370 [Thiohalobacter sp. IOR34]